LPIDYWIKPEAGSSWFASDPVKRIIDRLLDRLEETTRTNDCRIGSGGSDDNVGGGKVVRDVETLLEMVVTAYE
ncbi:unnamed protein product, partial [Dovyalis caffra]